jgi:hypothetical protein
LRWGVGEYRHGSWTKKVWEELADTGKGLSGAGEVGSHKCTRGREDKVRRKGHIYCRTLSAGGVVRCGSTKAIHKREKAANERIVGGMKIFKMRVEGTAPVMNGKEHRQNEPGIGGLTTHMPQNRDS